MIVHVLGWLTVASTAVVGAYVTRLTFTAGRPARQYLAVPSFTDAPLLLSSGSDYVGAC